MREARAVGWGENDRKTKEFKLGLQAFRPDESGSYIGACYERHCSWMGWRDFGRTIPLRRIGLSAMYTRFPLLWHRCAGEARDGGASNRRTRAKSGERRWRKGEIENETLIVLDGMDTDLSEERNKNHNSNKMAASIRQIHVVSYVSLTSGSGAFQGIMSIKLSSFGRKKRKKEKEEKRERKKETKNTDARVR